MLSSDIPASLLVASPTDLDRIILNNGEYSFDCRILSNDTSVSWKKDTKFKARSYFCFQMIQYLQILYKWTPKMLGKFFSLNLLEIPNEQLSYRETKASIIRYFHKQAGLPSLKLLGLNVKEHFFLHSSSLVQI